MELPTIPPRVALILVVVLFGLAGALDRDTHRDLVMPTAAPAVGELEAHVSRQVQQLHMLCQAQADDRHEMPRGLVYASVGFTSTDRGQQERWPARELHCVVIEK